MSNKLFILFGATGSLARLKIFLSLSQLFLSNDLNHTKVLAYGRKEFDNESFRKYLNSIPNLDKDFINSVDYLMGDTVDTAPILNYISANKIEKVFCYISLPPNLYPQTIDFIDKFTNGMDYRIALEKPFGTSLSEANNLAKKIKEGDLSRFYLVDHYLAKEAIINFPKIDINKVAKIEVSIFEKVGIEGREVFYDQTGAAIDTVQSHILNSLAKFDANFLKGMKYKTGTLILGQYGGYLQLPGISPDSKTETYFKAEFKYYDVDVVVRSGKAMNQTKAYILIEFKNGKTSEIVIKPNSKEVRTPHEYIIQDFLIDGKKFGVSLSDTVLSWKIIDPIVEEKESVDLVSYPKRSDFSQIESGQT